MAGLNIKLLETIREKWQSRLDGRCEKEDGSSASGNWGHVGRPGERGGSQKGGGYGFRMYKTAAKKYTSQSKMRKEAKSAHAKAKKSGNAKAIARAERRMSRINMNVKSADKRNIGRKGYQVVNKIDLNASRNIMRDPKRGRTARESTVSKVSGTRETINYTFPNRTTRGGSGSRGGKTRRRTKS